ncbi:MAG: transposase [Bacillus sp. (in: Bacteria)]|nr:transposase [Bacillus sp. (in: firmicutes)]
MKQNSGVIKKILKDHFDGFWRLHHNRFPKQYQSDIQNAVMKAIRCGTSDIGFAKYECLGCVGDPKPVFVGFSCKSRFCHKCGKKYTDDWSDKQEEMIFDVPHRHMVFTIPKECRPVFFEDRKKLNELSEQVAEVFRFHYNRMSKKRQLKVGIITVIHTFGRDLKWNPHIHVLVTEGALDKNKEWRSSEYIPYEYLRKSWQKVLMDAMKAWFPNNTKVHALVNDLYKRYPKGFYVNAEKKMKNAKGAAKYIGRYLARPAIAEYRIESYDGQTVRFWYEDHKTGKRIDAAWPVYKFLFEMLQHIPPKHFRMVGRFGLYSRKLYRKTNQILSLYAFVRTHQLSLLLEKKKRKKTYRQRMIEAFDKDPFQCPYCHRDMDLTEIWHPEHGFTFHYMQGMKCIKFRRNENVVKKRAG